MFGLHRSSARVLAATAHSDIREIRAVPPTGDNNSAFEVYALCGERLTHMLLELRANGSVAEHTDWE